MMAHSLNASVLDLIFAFLPQDVSLFILLRLVMVQEDVILQEVVVLIFEVALA